MEDVVGWPGLSVCSVRVRRVVLGGRQQRSAMWGPLQLGRRQKTLKRPDFPDANIANLEKYQTLCTLVSYVVPGLFIDKRDVNNLTS